MQISLEIPLPHIKEFLPLTDFPFGLAHLMDEHPFYAAQMEGCLLDNGMYENRDRPLSIDELLEAARLCRPTAIIAPDWMDDGARTAAAASVMLEKVRFQRVKFTIGAVVQGDSLTERLQCFSILQRLGCSPICFPFRTPRKETIRHLHERDAFEEDGWYHLLGLSAIHELTWQFLGRWSIDTGKPFKGVRLDDEGPIRGLGRLDLEHTLKDDEIKSALYNIAYMRKIAQEE